MSEKYRREENAKSFAMIQKYKDKVWTIGDFAIEDNHSTIIELTMAFSNLHRNFCNEVCGNTSLEEIKNKYLKQDLVPCNQYIQHVCVKLNTFYDHGQKTVYPSQITAWTRLCVLFGENKILAIMTPYRDKYEWFLQTMFRARDYVQDSLGLTYLVNLVWDFIGWTDSINQQLQVYLKDQEEYRHREICPLSWYIAPDKF